MPKVSIIMATYNGEEKIKESIESILRQSHKDIELIIVDDGSTDDTSKTIKEFEDPRIRYFYQENSGGPASPKNEGIRVAKGDFIGFCDQDDIWYKEKIVKQLEAYKNCKEKGKVGLIISSADLIDMKGQEVNHNIIPFEGFKEAKKSREKLLGVSFITACSVLIPKKVLDQVNLFDEGLAGVDDYDLWLRISEKYGILALKDSLCAWRQNKRSFSADKVKQYIETEKIFEKIEKSDKSKVVMIGHGKNLARIFMSLTFSKKYDEAKKYKFDALRYPLSRKIKFVLTIFSVSPTVCLWSLLFLRSIGRVSL